MEVVHQTGQTMGLAECLYRPPSDYNETEWSKSAQELWESWFVVTLVDDVSKNCDGQVFDNKLLNKLFKRPIELQEARQARESSEH